MVVIKFVLHTFQGTRNVLLLEQFVIFNPWNRRLIHVTKSRIFKNLNTVCNFHSIKNPMELNNLLWKFFCYITWLDVTLDNLQTRYLRQILLFLWNNSLAVWKLRAEFKKTSRPQLSRQFAERPFQEPKILLKSPKLIGQKLLS